MENYRPTLVFSDELSKALNFTYRTVEADTFGWKNSNGTWVGVLGNLFAGRADTASCSMVNIPERADFDFTTSVSLGKITLNMARSESKILD